MVESLPTKFKLVEDSDCPLVENSEFDYNAVRRRCEEAMRIMKNPVLLKRIAELLNVSLEVRREKRRKL
jgi:hypothetical protein